MKPFWSRIARELSPYVPGEQPRIANLVKLNTNESPFGPSPLALEAMRNAATDTLRLYPDPEARELREVLAAHHSVKPEQVFVGNGSDEVLAHANCRRHNFGRCDRLLHGVALLHGFSTASLLTLGGQRLPHIFSIDRDISRSTQITPLWLALCASQGGSTRRLGGLRDPCSSR
jgi:hypothetical protein